MAYERVIPLRELWRGDMTGRVVAGRRVLLVRLDDDVLAFEDRCAHLGMPLSEGTLDGHVLTCGAHHYQYDARTGAGINPTAVRLRRLAVRVEHGDVFVDPEIEAP